MRRVTGAEQPIPAATLVIFRRAADGGPPELLMVERAQSMVFAGGAAVFPGGRVDPADYALGHRLAPELDRDESAARVAAIRETLEEAGLVVGLATNVSAEEARAARALLLSQGELAPVLDRFGWQLDLGALIPFARWLPLGMQHHRIFDTRFYLADLGTGAVEIAVDETENTHLFWTSAAGALELADRGEISIIFPTRRNLERLALFGDFAAACAQAACTPIKAITPHFVDEGAERWLMIPDNAGYPVTRERIADLRRG